MRSMPYRQGMIEQVGTGPNLLLKKFNILEAESFWRFEKF